MKSNTFVALLLSAVTALAAPPEQNGKNIFTARCASCHAVNKILTGPALAGVEERRSMDWIVSFVRSSQTMVKAGDKEAIAVFETFNKIPMPDHADLSAADIQDIVAFVKSEATASSGETAPFAKPAKLRPAYTPVTFTNAEFFIGYFIVIALLILALLFAVEIKGYERNHEQVH